MAVKNGIIFRSNTGVWCTKGSIHFRADTGWWFVRWYDEKTKTRRNITWYKGNRMFDKSLARKCLAVMQSDYENGIFRIEKFNTKGTDVVPFFEEWLKLKEKKAPATYKGYKSYLRCHIAPFFERHPGIMLNDIRLDTLHALLESMRSVDGKPLSGKMKYNVMGCFHAFMTYAYRSERILAMPPFPKKEDYGLVEPAIRWLPEDRQVNIIRTIPEEHQPIFWFLKYHYRRPGEAMALHKQDYDIVNGVFIIRRSISNEKLVNHTKTHREHIIPCVSDFRETADRLAKLPGKYFFTCRSSRSDGHRYTQTIMNRLWNTAAAECGETINMYSGLKHSACSQYINEKGGNLADLQVITDHARYESVKKYAKTQVARKRQLMERKRVNPIFFKNH